MHLFGYFRKHRAIQPSSTEDMTGQPKGNSSGTALSDGYTIFGDVEDRPRVLAASSADTTNGTGSGCTPT